MPSTHWRGKTACADPDLRPGASRTKDLPDPSGRTGQLRRTAQPSEVPGRHAAHRPDPAMAASTASRSRSVPVNCTTLCPLSPLSGRRQIYEADRPMEPAAVSTSASSAGWATVDEVGSGLDDGQPVLPEWRGRRCGASIEAALSARGHRWASACGARCRETCRGDDVDVARAGLSPRRRMPWPNG